MDAKASIFLLPVSLLALVLVAGCPEAPLPAGPPSAFGGDDPGASLNAAPGGVGTGSISGHLTVSPAIAKNESLEKGIVSPAGADGNVEGVIPGELLVTFDETVTAEERAAILAEYGMEEIECSPSGVCRVATPPQPEVDPRQAKVATVDDAALLSERPGVVRASPNLRRYIARTPDDRHYPLQWHYPLMNLPAAWDVTTGSDSIVVAVVDTGILKAHPDFQGRLVPGYDFIADPAAARDGDGRDPDPEDAGDLFNGPGQSSYHGTHVAGTIGAATNNGVGVAGVTWFTRIMPVRALGVDGGTTFDVAEAIRFAAGLPNVSGTVPEMPARIINLSVAGDPGGPSSPEETAAIRAAVRAGVLVVAASGNGHSSEPAWPAAQAEAISVGAVDMNLVRAGYSNYGATLDLVAPGGVNGTDVNGDGYPDSILSLGVTEGAEGALTYRYVFSSGTSMAAPHVSGVAALMLAVNPSLNVAQMRTILESTALDLGPAGWDEEYGHGMVDAAAAVQEALRLAGQPGAAQPAPPVTGAPAPDAGAPEGETVYVLAMHAGTFQPAAQAETSAARGYAYELHNLPPGDYILYAGTDRDGDGFICDAGDLCGAMPAVAAPAVIAIEAGEQLDGIEFGLLILEGGPVEPLHLPRMW